MKQLSKVFLLLSLVLTVFFASCNQVQAVDLTVNCAANGPCQMLPTENEALFFETNWLPGDSVSQSIVVNNNDSDETCNLSLDTKNEVQFPTNFTGQLFTVIKEGTNDIFGVRDGLRAAGDQNLNDLYNLGPISLGTIAPNSSLSLDWVVTFNLQAGNEYQMASTTFDFDLVFSCDGPATTDVCANIDGIQTSVPADYHIDASGVNCVQWQLGGAPTGGGGSSSTTTSGVLGTFTTRIRKMLPVLGAFEEVVEVEPSSSPVPSLIPEVKGQDTISECGKYFRWWIPLVIQAAVMVIYIVFVYLKKKENTKFTRFMMLPLVIALISQIAHFIIGCPCTLTVWCRWYWAFNLIIVLITALIYLILLAKREKTD